MNSKKASIGFSSVVQRSILWILLWWAESSRPALKLIGYGAVGGSRRLDPPYDRYGRYRFGDMEILFGFQFFDDLREQSGVVLLEQMIDAGLRYSQFLQRLDSGLQGSLPFFSLGQEQLAD